MKISKAYTLIRQERIQELDSEAYILRHNKSGAKLFLLSNQDPNKVFTIGFRTPVSDSTGVPHILEHSVLCGSDRFPVKDPFMEMAKSSLQTYLNAMTFSDKTIYPVASCNDKDFQNLMAVYMDAVLHPMIYKEEKIFRQEGWHYELESPEEELTVNGVVYNEMKGAFSSADEVLDRYCQSTLFPDVTYCHESGGDPQCIPTLTYEQFLNFHRTYYHPSNSYIYLYGNMDMEEKLQWLDQEYLSQYSEITVNSRIPLQKAFPAPVESEIPYPLAAGESEEGQTYFSLQWVTGENTDPILHQAFQVLEYALLGAQGAPLKQALLDAQIGEDVYGGYQNYTRQPFFSVVAKNACREQKEEFVSLVMDTLRRVAGEGIGEKALLAALNNLEFRSREADFGSYPKGLMYGIECFDSWLYDADPLMHLKYEETFAFLRENLNTGYFEGLIDTYFLKNSHRSLVTLYPKNGLAEERDEAQKKRLAEYKASLSPEEIENLVRETKALAEYQEEPTPRELLDTLPSLSRQDISRDIPVFSSVEKSIAGIPVVHHETNTSGITYLKLLYNVSDLPKEDLPALGLLRSLMCLVDTEHYSYQELSHEINIYTGGIGNNISLFEKVETPGLYRSFFEIHTKVMGPQLSRSLKLMEEVLRHSSYRDQKRLRELVGQMKSRGEMQMISSGHSTAVLRAASYGAQTSYYNEQIGGIDYFRYLEDITAHFAEKGEALSEKLMSLSARLFDPSRLLISVTCDGAAYEQLERELPEYFGEAKEHFDAYVPAFELSLKNEAFKTAGQVQYVALCGNYRKAGLPYTGALRVLRGILSDEYLWNQIRVRGGAYGCMCNFSRNGSGLFVSYRDPHLKRTLSVYRGMVDYLKQFTADEKTMSGFIIGAIGTLDRPLTPADWGSNSFQIYMNGITDEMRQIDRDQVLGCTEEDIRKLAAYVQALLDQNQICVVGSGSKIEEEKELFLHTENLIHG